MRKILFLTCFMGAQLSLYAQFKPTFSAEHAYKVMHLSPTLDEISALTIYNNKLIALQDENGTLYHLDDKTGAILDSFTFNEKGDFEALTASKNTIWAFETKGNLWEIEDWGEGKKTKINKYHTPFSKKNDVEGIAFDEKKNRLLMACKESPFLNTSEDKIEDSRSIYAFDLKTKTLLPAPVISYNFDTIGNFLKNNPQVLLHPKAQKAIDKGKKMKLKPTDITIHPKNKDIYVLCGTAYTLLIFDAKTYKLKGINSLDDDIFNQAEGLTFLPNGDLYIATEKDKLQEKAEDNFEKGDMAFDKEKVRNARIYAYHILFTPIDK